MTDNMMEVFGDFRKEFSVNDNGSGYASKRGLARMCEVSHRSWGRSGSLFTQEIDEMLKQYGFDSGSIFNKKGEIIDTVCFIVIQYYAFKGRKTAQKYSLAIGSGGLRTIIQKVVGWQPPSNKYTPYILKEPRKWTKMFGDDFYDELSRLTGLTWDRKTHEQERLAKQLYAMS